MRPKGNRKIHKGKIHKRKIRKGKIHREQHEAVQQGENEEESGPHIP